MAISWASEIRTTCFLPETGLVAQAIVLPTASDRTIRRRDRGAGARMVVDISYYVLWRCNRCATKTPRVQA